MHKAEKARDLRGRSAVQGHSKVQRPFDHAGMTHCRYCATYRQFAEGLRDDASSWPMNNDAKGSARYLTVPSVPFTNEDDEQKDQSRSRLDESEDGVLATAGYG
jgi:hypothetical protein